MTQRSFASLDYTHKKKRTKRDIFLSEMEAVVPWGRLEALIAPHYTKKNPRGGTIMDATLIAASPSTKNKTRKRDPEMSHSKKGNQWHFGMKAHVGMDAKSGLVHTVETTTGKVHDAKLTDGLIHKNDKVVFGDKGYVSDKRKRAARAKGIYWAVKDKRKPGKALSSSQKKRNKKHGRIRAKVEHVFRVIKCQFKYRKVRYKGLAKNTAQIFSLMALANLYMARKRLRAKCA